MASKHGSPSGVGCAGLDALVYDIRSVSNLHLLGERHV